MSRLAKPLTVALILASTVTAGSAFAQTAPSPELTAAQINDWTLKAPVKNQSLFLKLDNEDTATLFTPLPNRNPERITKIEIPAYSRFDVSNFNYPVLGPINLTVQADYQELLSPNNTLQVIDITYESPDSSPYSQTPYQVATTATAQVKFTF